MDSIPLERAWPLVMRHVLIVIPHNKINHYALQSETEKTSDTCGQTCFCCETIARDTKIAKENET